MACFFFTIDCLLLLKIFYRVNLEIRPFYKFLIYKFHLFLSKAIVAIHKLLFYSSFEATWLMSQPSTCLNISRLPLSKWLKSCFLTEEEMQLGLLLFTERRGPYCIRSQTFAILDGRSVIFSTFYACVFEKTFYRILRVKFVKVNSFNNQ